MSSKVEKIEVSHTVGELIRERAEAAGMTPDDYLRGLMVALPSKPQVGPSLEQIDQILDELAAGGENLPPLPKGFSRKDIYYDHD